MLHERLREAREARDLSVNDLAAQIGVRSRLVELIEAGAYDQLPSGVYARSSIRGYAKAMGVDPEAALAEVGHLLARPEDPLDGLARAKGYKRRPPAAGDAPPADVRVRAHASESMMTAPVPAAPVSPPVMAAEPLAVALERGDALADAGSVVATMPLDGWQSLDDAPLAQPTPAEEVTPAAPSRAPRLRWAVMRAEWWRPVAASLIDGLFLGGIGLVLVWLTVRACGTDLMPTLRVAGPAMALLFALIVSIYFVLLGGVRNETLGTRLAGLRRESKAGAALDVRAVLTRACHCFARQVTVPWDADAIRAGREGHRRAETLS